MPELPEVETLVRALRKTVVDRRIEHAELKKPNMFVSPYGIQMDDLQGRAIKSLKRRAKMLIFELSGDVTMAIHLKLAGQLSHRKDGEVLAVGGHPVPRFDAELPHKSTHGRFDLDDGSIIWLTDVRQFGRVTLLPSVELDALFSQKKLGVEPLGRQFTASHLARHFRRHKLLPVKSALLDQSHLVGVGNIYADEALSWSRIHPERMAGSLDDKEMARLHRATRAVLNYAIKHGVPDLPFGRGRTEQKFPRTHGRAGMPCLKCKRPIHRIYVGGRATDFCPKCQPAR